MAMRACWSSSAPPDGGSGEHCAAVAVDLTNNPTVNAMSPDQNKRADRRELLLASAMVVAGLTISGLAITQLKAGNPLAQVAQATPPLHSTPGAETKPSAPSEPATTGSSSRPPEVPPQPANPGADAQRAGAAPALPPAPAEKTAPPIKDR
jgi:hypothetical protein